MDADQLRSLEKALESECGEGILEETENTVRNNVDAALDASGIGHDHKRAMLQKLIGYRLAYDLEVLEYGCFVRWYTLVSAGPAALRHGGFVIEVKLGDEGTMVVCKNACGRIFQFCFEQCIVFRKLSTQEKVILRALEVASMNDCI